MVTMAPQKSRQVFLPHRAQVPSPWVRQPGALSSYYIQLEVWMLSPSANSSCVQNINTMTVVPVCHRQFPSMTVVPVSHSVKSIQKFAYFLNWRTTVIDRCIEISEEGISRHLIVVVVLSGCVTQAGSRPSLTLNVNLNQWWSTLCHECHACGCAYSSTQLPGCNWGTILDL